MLLWELMCPISRDSCGSPLAEAGAGPAPLTAARGRGHGQDPNRTPRGGGAGPSLAAPLLRKLFLGYSSFHLVVWTGTNAGAFSYVGYIKYFSEK